MLIVSGESDHDRNLVGFRVGGVNYALDIHHVREVVKPLEVLSLPHVPPMVVGVFDHRGEVVPVLDLRLRFSVTPQGDPREERWIIVSRDTGLSALVVDAVTEVFGSGGPDVRDVPDVGGGAEARAIAAVRHHRGGLVFVLDVDVLTSIADKLDLRSMRPVRGPEVDSP